MQYGVDVFADLTKEGNEPHVQRTAYRLLNILGAHGTLSLPLCTCALCVCRCVRVACGLSVV
jgi:hypothetical protein